MSEDRENGYFIYYDFFKVQKHFDRLLSTVYPNLKNVEGVDWTMGGRVIYDEIDKAFDEGIEQGIEQGKEQGIEENRVSSIKNLMKNLNLSAVDAMISLGIPEEEHSKYLDKI